MKKLLFLILLFLILSCTRTSLDTLVPSEVRTPSVIYFGGDYCVHCRSFESSWEKAQTLEEYKDIKFYKEDDIRTNVSLLYNVNSVPTVVFIDEDKNITKITGKQFMWKFKDNLNKFCLKKNI